MLNLSPAFRRCIRFTAKPNNHERKQKHEEAENELPNEINKYVE